MATLDLSLFYKYGFAIWAIIIGCNLHVILKYMQGPLALLQRQNYAWYKLQQPLSDLPLISGISLENLEQIWV